MGYENDIVTKVTTLIENHEKSWDDKPTRKQLTKFIKKLEEGGVTFEEYYVMKVADLSAKNPSMILKYIEELSNLLDFYKSTKLDKLDLEEMHDRLEDMGIVPVHKGSLNFTIQDIKNDSLLMNVPESQWDFAMEKALEFAVGNNGLNNKKEFIYLHLYQLVWSDVLKTK